MNRFWFWSCLICHVFATFFKVCLQIEFSGVEIWANPLIFYLQKKKPWTIFLFYLCGASNYPKNLSFLFFLSFFLSFSLSSIFFFFCTKHNVQRVDWIWQNAFLSPPVGLYLPRSSIHAVLLQMDSTSSRADVCPGSHYVTSKSLTRILYSSSLRICCIPKLQRRCFIIFISFFFFLAKPPPNISG